MVPLPKELVPTVSEAESDIESQLEANRLAGVMPLLEQRAAAAQKLIANKAAAAQKSGTLTGELAITLWLEYNAVANMLRNLQTTVSLNASE